MFVCKLWIVFSVSVLLCVHTEGQRNCQHWSECPEVNEIIRRIQNGEKLSIEERNAFTDAQCSYIHQQVNCMALKTWKHVNRALVPAACGFRGSDRIIGGEGVDIGEFPWMALIKIKTRFGPEWACGGSIISSRYIMTAAHCVHDREVLGVRVGEYDLTLPMDCKKVHKKFDCYEHKDFAVEKIIIHREYDAESISRRHDIALLRLSTAINFNQGSKLRAAPVCLPMSPSELKLDLDGMTCTVAGWGSTENGTSSNIPMKVEIPVYSDMECRNFFQGIKVQERYRADTSTHLCAGVAGKDSCQGDSGGPLFVTTEHDNYPRAVQYGIVSFGLMNCGEENKPGLYTDVGLHLDWILDHLQA